MDPKKEEVITNIRQDMRKYMFITGFGIGPFVYLAREKNNKWLVLPSIGILIAGKFFMDREMK
jgi:hypothetical protein